MISATNRKIHRWLGTIPAIIFLIVSVTGILLIFSKQLKLSPNAEKGANVSINKSISMEKVLDIALNVNKNELKSVNDIKRIEFQPKSKIYKVRTKKGFDIQIDMSTGKVLRAEKNIASTILSIHTGAYFGNWFKTYLVTGASVALIITSITGIYLFFLPIVRRRKYNRR